ncbi:hypothetical protein EV192_107153 [Actinocrispum wychmicini]|uniref:Adaptive response protein AidB N-terminal domain-containing protein n=1 Tax=Actinocrispum wychmicini TaxID=1213861 RepID=A0A4V2S6E4_9PSEU|nr:hypothetical protein EV192_107153 [Actinocrispum wychmicini]
MNQSSASRLLAPIDVRAAPAPQPGPRANRAHEVRTMPAGLAGYNALSSDPVMTATLDRAGASWAEREISELGALIGSPELAELSRAANRYVPTLHTHDRTAPCQLMSTRRCRHEGRLVVTNLLHRLGSAWAMHPW